MVYDDMCFTCKTVMVELLQPVKIPSASLYMLLYHHAVLDRLFLAKVMGQIIALSSTSSYLQLMSSLTCHKVAPRPTPGASVSRYNSFLTLYYFMPVYSFISDLALSYISWYDLFQVQTALTDVSFLSGSHTSAVIGGN